MTKKSLTALLLITIMATTAYLAFNALAGAEEDPFGVIFDDDL